jgi:16S rRNA (cytosine1402-N4)-methyltransferase
MQHQPVLLREVMESASECPREVRRVLDGTFGRGGHTRAFLEQFPLAAVVALDRDRDAVDFGLSQFREEISSGRLRLIHANFADLEDLSLGAFDFALLDLGVSSPQLDTPERGFSFYKEGPLDMRMNRDESLSARDIVNFWDEDDLVELFQKYGEVRSPHKVVRALARDRQVKPLETTMDLAKLIERVSGWARKGRHPATQYFLALRIRVNGEFDVAERGTRAAVHSLNEGGRLAVITFHSAEDRIVKYAFREMAETAGVLVNKKVIIPSRQEESSNPRSRSAKLRVFQKGSVHE